MIPFGSIRQKPTIIGYTQTSSSTVANTTNETTLLTSGVGSLTLPANYLTVGKTISVKVSGRHSAVANPGINIRIKLGTTTVLTTGLVASGNSTNDYFEVTGYITCRTVGSSGTVWGDGFYVETGGGTGRFSMANTSTTTINTTVAQTIDVTAQWDTASTSDTLTSDIAFIYSIN